MRLSRRPVSELFVECSPCVTEPYQALDQCPHSGVPGCKIRRAQISGFPPDQLRFAVMKTLLFLRTIPFFFSNSFELGKSKCGQVEIRSTARPACPSPSSSNRLLPHFPIFSLDFTIDAQLFRATCSQNDPKPQASPLLRLPYSETPYFPSRFFR